MLGEGSMGIVVCDCCSILLLFVEWRKREEAIEGRGKKQLKEEGRGKRDDE